jgi:hypothetical protein
MFRRSPTKVLALALAVLANACGSDSSTGPSNQAATLDQALSEFSIPAISAANTAFFDAGASAPALLLSRCAFAAGSQSFVCTPFSANGVTINQSFTLLSASGAAQPAFVAGATDAVRADQTMAGNISGGGTSLSVDATQELTLSGLISGPHTLDGTSTTKLKGTIADIFGSKSLDATLATTITNLVLPARSAVSPGAQVWPASGTIVVQSTGTVGTASIGTTQITMTFSGTSIVNVSRTGPGGSQICKMDLSKLDQPCA